MRHFQTVWFSQLAWRRAAAPQCGLAMVQTFARASTRADRSARRAPSSLTPLLP